MSSWACTVLRAGGLRLDGGSMFGVVPRTLWSRLAQPDSANRIPLAANCLLLRRGSDTVLVETGCGGKWDEKTRGIFAIDERTVVDALAEHDVEPADIDAVIVTHLHFDHAGGLTSRGEAGPMPTFPGAEVIVQRREWEDARAGRSTMTGTYLAQNLEPVAQQVRLIDGEEEVLPGIRVLPVPGHTWGQHAVLVETARGPVCFPGDLVPTRNHLGSAWSMGYDMLPYENMLTKRSVFTRAASDGWTIVLDHEPGDPVTKVARDGDWFAWENSAIG